MIKKLYRRLYPAHVWREDGDDTRTCTVCGQKDELDYGGGCAGSMWISIQDGDRAKHETGAPPAAETGAMKTIAVLAAVAAALVYYFAFGVWAAMANEIHADRMEAPEHQATPTSEQQETDYFKRVAAAGKGQ